MGGTLRAIETGYIQGEIQNAAFEIPERGRIGRADGRRREPFPNGGRETVPAFRIDPAIERSQVESLRQVRASRSAAVVDETSGGAGAGRAATAAT